MTRRSRVPAAYPSRMAALRTAGTIALACLTGWILQPAFAENGGNGVPAFAPGMIRHMQTMRHFPDRDRGDQMPPMIIPRFEVTRDPAGALATFQPGGATFPGNNAFFQDLGTNGRTCFTCHQGQSGWSVSAENVAARFAASHGADPIFRLVDGANCPSADVSTLSAKRKAYALLIDKGLLRIGLPMPAN